RFLKPSKSYKVRWFCILHRICGESTIMPVSKKIIYWNRWHAGLLLLFGFWAMLASMPFVLSGIAAVSFFRLGWIHRDLLRTYRPFGGYANWVTGLRLLIILLFPYWLALLTHQAFFFLALLVILADGLDGYLARKFQTESLFGAYFDMESDAFYVCMMSFLLYWENLLPFWILLVGWMRYGAVLVEVGLGIHGQPLPPNPFARSIAGVLFVALLLPWILPPQLYFIPVAIAAGLVSFSFAYSFYLAFREM
ncbi:MAG: CDP-alcohol phosphatidyltransferase family protein, partial [Bacteroidota bacterium]